MPEPNDTSPENPSPPPGVDAAVALAERTLTGDLRDAILMLFRDERNPWHLMDEMRQTRLAETVEQLCETLVSRAVRIIAGRDFPAIGVALDQVSFKPKGVEAKMTFGVMDAKTRHSIVDAQGSKVVIVVADPDVYRGARGIARVDKQEPELPLGEAPALNDDPAPPPADAAPHDDSGEPRLEALDDSGNPATGYTIGYEDGRSGETMGASPFPVGSPEYARYCAGWLQAQADGFKDDARAHQAALAKCADFFRELGCSSPRGTTLADCPLAAWMPATKWWREGLLDGIRSRAEAHGDADEPNNPYDPESTEGKEWLAAWRRARGEDGAETSAEPRRRGRPRKGDEPPADQPGA